MKTFILTLLLLWMMPLTCYSQPNSWQGLTPLRSTRAEVERRWGPSGSPCQCAYFTEHGNEHISIVYSDGPCGALGWNVPKDTVISISVTPRKDRPLLSDLKVDLTKYQKVSGGDVEGNYFYIDKKAGVYIEVLNNIVIGYIYKPSAEDEHLRCLEKPLPKGPQRRVGKKRPQAAVGRD